eukprot:2481237-Pyramimonas_sp.AAC.1
MFLDRRVSKGEGPDVQRQCTRPDGGRLTMSASEGRSRSPGPSEAQVSFVFPRHCTLHVRFPSHSARRVETMHLFSAYASLWMLGLVRACTRHSRDLRDSKTERASREGSRPLRPAGSKMEIRRKFGVVRAQSSPSTSCPRRRACTRGLGGL